MERRYPTDGNPQAKKGGKEGVIKPTISLQDLRKRIYTKAKAEKPWRFWGLYTHVCKRETLEASYKMAKANKGAAGIDGVTFAHIEERGVQSYLEAIGEELIDGTYKPMRTRQQRIPKGKGQERILSIPAIRDRIVQGALRLILEPIFEADFQEGSYGYRPRKRAHEAIHEVSRAIVKRHTKVIDVDLRAYFDNVNHALLLAKVANRVEDKRVLHLLKLILKSSGNCGVAQGGVISPLLSNIYLNEVDKMLEKAKEVTREGRYTHVSYARFADDIVVLVDCLPKWNWLEQAIYKRLLEELRKLKVELNEEKTRRVNLDRRESFRFLGFDFRAERTREGKWWAYYSPTQAARSELIKKLKEIFRRHRSRPIEGLVGAINPILRGWVNYFRVGHATKQFKYVSQWVEKKVRRQLRKARKRRGFGWKRWSKEWIHETLGLYQDYEIRYVKPKLKVS